MRISIILKRLLRRPSYIACCLIPLTLLMCVCWIYWRVASISIPNASITETAGAEFFDLTIYVDNKLAQPSLTEIRELAIENPTGVFFYGFDNIPLQAVAATSTFHAALYEGPLLQSLAAPFSIGRPANIDADEIVLTERVAQDLYGSVSNAIGKRVVALDAAGKPFGLDVVGVLKSSFSGISITHSTQVYVQQRVWLKNLYRTFPNATVERLFSKFSMRSGLSSTSYSDAQVKAGQFAALLSNLRPVAATTRFEIAPNLTLTPELRDGLSRLQRLLVAVSCSVFIISIFALLFAELQRRARQASLWTTFAACGMTSERFHVITVIEHAVVIFGAIALSIPALFYLDHALLSASAFVEYGDLFERRSAGDFAAVLSISLLGFVPAAISGHFQIRFGKRGWGAPVVFGVCLCLAAWVADATSEARRSYDELLARSAPIGIDDLKFVRQIRGTIGLGDAVRRACLGGSECLFAILAPCPDEDQYPTAFLTASEVTVPILRATPAVLRVLRQGESDVPVGALIGRGLASRIRGKTGTTVHTEEFGKFTMTIGPDVPLFVGFSSSEGILRIESELEDKRACAITREYLTSDPDLASQDFMAVFHQLNRFAHTLHEAGILLSAVLIAAVSLLACVSGILYFAIRQRDLAIKHALGQSSIAALMEVLLPFTMAFILSATGMYAWAVDLRAVLGIMLTAMFVFSATIVWKWYFFKAKALLGADDGRK